MNMQVNKQKLAEAQARTAARYSPEDLARFAQERAAADAKWKAEGSPVGPAIDSLPGFGFGPNARLPRDPAKEAAYDQQWQQMFPQSGGGGLGPTHSYDEPWSPYVAQTSNGGGRDSFGGQGPLLNQPGDMSGGNQPGFPGLWSEPGGFTGKGPRGQQTGQSAGTNSAQIQALLNLLAQLGYQMPGGYGGIGTGPVSNKSGYGRGGNI